MRECGSMRTRTRERALVLVLVFASSLALGGMATALDAPEIRQPDALGLSTADQDALVLQMDLLADILADPYLGSRMRLGEGGWGADEFSLYTAGTLPQLGYRSIVATSSSWANGPHTWVLVELRLGQEVVWVPVEATPPAGRSQLTLGSIPLTSVSPAPGRFDERYTSYDQILNPPANQPPIAKLRDPVTTILTEEEATFLALSSHDPDGDIILYLWSVDGARGTLSRSWSYGHEFTTPGSHTIEVIVIDDRGARATASLRVNVLGESPSGDTGGGCGCRG